MSGLLIIYSDFRIKINYILLGQFEISWKKTEGTERAHALNLD